MLHRDAKEVPGAGKLNGIQTFTDLRSFLMKLPALDALASND
jgi:hypothetical protein